jgi:hypothetical protein
VCILLKTISYSQSALRRGYQIVKSNQWRNDKEKIDIRAIADPGEIPNERNQIKETKELMNEEDVM